MVENNLSSDNQFIATAESVMDNEYRPPNTEVARELVSADEFMDGPIRIEDLNDDEQKRLRVVIIGVIHTEPWSNEIADAIAKAESEHGPADYFVVEELRGGALPSAPVTFTETKPRIEYDRDEYTHAQEIHERMSKGHPVPGNELAALYLPVRIMTMRAAYSQQKLPIIRSMDVEGTDKPFDERYKNIGEEIRDAKANRDKLFSEDIFLENSTRLRQTMLQVIGETVSVNAAREQTQMDHVSTIAANAVKRHADWDKVTIYVFEGAEHTLTEKTLKLDTHIQTQIIYAPEVIGSTSGPFLDAVRSAAEGKADLSDISLNRVIIEAMLREVWLRSWSNTSDLALNQYLRDLTDDQVTEMINTTDAIKSRMQAETLSGMMNLGAKIRFAIEDYFSSFQDRYSDILEMVEQQKRTRDEEIERQNDWRSYRSQRMNQHL